ncbi:hypothetical protein B0H11DRAFT_1927128 [Mycena galericulata]|nr:hypothetical protein B0H11DRAFT_1927128 [Mycena galericulata]
MYNSTFSKLVTAGGSNPQSVASTATADPYNPTETGSEQARRIHRSIGPSCEKVEVEAWMESVNRISRRVHNAGVANAMHIRSKSKGGWRDDRNIRAPILNAFYEYFSGGFDWKREDGVNDAVEFEYHTFPAFHEIRWEVGVVDRSSSTARSMAAKSRRKC